MVTNVIDGCPYFDWNVIPDYINGVHLWPHNIRANYTAIKVIITKPKNALCVV